RQIAAFHDHRPDAVPDADHAVPAGGLRLWGTVRSLPRAHFRADLACAGDLHLLSGADAGASAGVNGTQTASISTRKPLDEGGNREQGKSWQASRSSFTFSLCWGHWQLAR